VGDDSSFDAFYRPEGRAVKGLGGDVPDNDGGSSMCRLRS
jgi:hypothetical protein